MLSSNIPATNQKIPAPVASSAAGSLVTKPIPTTVTGGSGLLSWDAGLQEVNMTLGGIAPFGADRNGLDFTFSSWLQWMQAGGAILPFDATFQGVITGYPKGAWVTPGPSFPGIVYVSLVESNTGSLTNTTDWQECRLLPYFVQPAPQHVRVQGATITGSYSDTKTLTVTAPIAGWAQAHAYLNTGGTPGQNISLSLSNSISGSSAADSVYYSQNQSLDVALSAGQSVTFTLAVTTGSGYTPNTSATYQLDVGFLATP